MAIAPFRSWLPAAILGLSALPALAAARGFRLDIPAVKAGGKLSDAQVFNGFGCSGRNISPAIRWSGAPAGTRSYALTLYDPDAPTGSGWWHWLVYDIPASASALPEHAGDADGKLLPAGAKQGRTDFGTAGFGGACPPAGDKPHHYIFTIYALKVEKIDVPAGASAAMIGFMLNANQLAKTSITALYGR
ncbi:MAG: YbhB/YbcL family Raf kinase inhibitor-like protein [Steroidobacteraceae bacterium]